MTARGGPPNEVGPRDTTPEGTDTNTSTPASALTKSSRRRDSNAQRPGLGAYGSGWCAGFTAGAADALLVAAREINDPAAWVALSRLAAYYHGAADRRAS